MVMCFCCFVKQTTANEMRISDWSSDVCSSDLLLPPGASMANHFVKASFVLTVTDAEAEVFRDIDEAAEIVRDSDVEQDRRVAAYSARSDAFRSCFPPAEADAFGGFLAIFSDPDYPRLGFSLQRSDEHTSELQSLI